jgi:hypothetical protein
LQKKCKGGYHGFGHRLGRDNEFIQRVEEKLKELIDFAQFLKAKKEKFSFAQVINSAEYVRKLREQE